MNTPQQVYISIGSNIDRERYISAALDALQGEFGELSLSSVYESEAVGFDGEPFLNMVVGVRTGLGVAELSRLFKQLEDDNDRQRQQPRFSARTLDLDILTCGRLSGEYGGVKLPRDEILKNAFVLLPLAELAPEETHPENGQTYRSLWQAYQRSQKLWPVSFYWQGRQISRL